MYARQVYSDWEMEERVGYGRGMIALFYRRAPARRCWLGWIRKGAGSGHLSGGPGAQVVSKWVGETENSWRRCSIRRERAHALPCCRIEADLLKLAKRHRKSAGSNVTGTATWRLTTRCSGWNSNCGSSRVLTKQKRPRA